MVVEEMTDLAQFLCTHRHKTHCPEHLGTSVVALGRCHGSHPETVPAHCAAAGGCTQLLGFDVTTALQPFRFAMAFEPPANHPARCHMHVGGSGTAFPALAAGAIPVYHGPNGAPEVFNREAVVIV